MGAATMNTLAWPTNPVMLGVVVVDHEMALECAAVGGNSFAVGPILAGYENLLRGGVAVVGWREGGPSGTIH